MSETENMTGLRVKGRLMSASEIERTLVRLAHEIVERNNGSENLGLVGIKRRGVPLAQRLGTDPQTLAQINSWLVKRYKAYAESLMPLSAAAE